MASHDEVRGLVRQLREDESVLPQALRSALLARGAEAVGPLLEVLRGKGFAPIHAAELLLALRAPESLLPLVEALARTEPGDVLQDVLLLGLEAWGPEVAPVALEVLDRTPGAWGRAALLELLASCGARDERILTLLLEQLQSDVTYAAMNLARYGDARAIEPLQRALDGCPLEEDTVDLLVLQDMVELAAAIRELGGTLSEAQEQKLAEGRALRARAFGSWWKRRAPSPHRRPERPGRNAPCWCGSGIKYKKCHLASDRVVGQGAARDGLDDL